MQIQMYLKGQTKEYSTKKKSICPFPKNCLEIMFFSGFEQSRKISKVKKVKIQLFLLLRVFSPLYCYS